MIIEQMAPSSLKKMSGSKGRKEGNYASSDGSTLLDVFISDNLGLTLLPRPQVQNKDAGEKVQATVGRPTTVRATEQQRDSQRCPLELQEQCHPVTRRSALDESIGGSYCFGLSNRVEYSNIESYDDEAIVRSDDCCFGIQGNHDLKRTDLSVPTETIPKDIGQGLHHDRKADTEYSWAPYQCSLTEERREIEREISFQSSNQMLGEEMRKVGFNGSSDSLGSVLGNEHKCDKNIDAKACENLLKHESCGSKGKESENLLLTSASGNIGGLTLTKSMTDNRLGGDYPLSLPNGSAQRPYHSTRTEESENPTSVVPETNNRSHVASALLVPVELQHSSKAIPTAHQQALNSLQVSPQLILKRSKASRNAHAAPPEKASKLVKHLKRSWTRHFPTRTKDLPSKSQGSGHAHTSSATPSCSIASKIYSNPPKTCFARENRYKIVTHLDSRILATSPPISIEISSQASYGLCDRYNQVAHTGTVQSRLKAGIKRSKTLPDLRLLHQTSNMNLQQGHQQRQYSTPPCEQPSVGDNLQCLDPNYTSLPTHYVAQPTPRDISGDINTPLPGVDYQGMNANISQPAQSPTITNRGAPIYGYSPFRVNIYGANPRTVFNYPVSTNDGLINSNGERSHTTTEFMTLSEQYNALRQRVRNHEAALEQARKHNQISEATIEKLKREIKVLKQQLKFETTIEAKSPKDGVKTKSSRNRGVVSTVQWARQSHPTAGQQSLNVRSASLEDTSIPLTNDEPSLESGATMNTMVSPTQYQSPAVPTPAPGYSSTQANHIQSLYSGSFQPEVQSIPSPYTSANSLIPTYSPYLTYAPNRDYSRDPPYSPNLTHPPEPHLSGQYSSHGFQPGHPFQNQGKQFQQGPGDCSAGCYQQSPHPSVSRTPQAPVQAEASTSGIKRKRGTEPDAAPWVERQQQQPVETQPGLPPEQAASDEQAQKEAWTKMLRKDFPWYDGVLPSKQNPKDGKQFGLPSASLPQAATHPALDPQAPIGLIAPTPGRAPRQTKQKTPTMRKVPKTDLEKKEKRAQYNRRYKANQKAKECLQKDKAAANLETCETTLPLSTADSHAGLLPYRLLDSVQEDYADIIPQSSFSKTSDLDPASQTQQPHGTTSSGSTNNLNPDGLSPEDQAFAAELEAEMMAMDDDDPLAQAADDATDRTMETENDDPTAQAVEDATVRTINEIIDGEEEEDEEESEESEEE